MAGRFTLFGVLLICSSALRAQLVAPNAAGVTMGHLHMNVRDVEANQKFWSTLGATATTMGPFQVMKFQGVLVFLNLTPQSPPATGGNDKAVVNQFGIVVRDLAQALSRWQADGIKTQRSGNANLAYILTPDNIKVEVTEDRSLRVPVANNNIRFAAALPATPAEMAEWYSKTFGGKRASKGLDQTVQLPGVTLIFSKSSGKAIPTKSLLLDHIGFEIDDLEAFCKKLEESGVKFDVPYRQADSGLGLAFLTDPWGTYIELNEGLDQL